MTHQAVNVNQIIDHAKFTPFHFRVVAWCLLIILFDGYDLAINGVVLPLLMDDWGLSAVQAGMLASTALAGMMFGAMIFGSLADKIGRKKVIMICIVLFSGLTFAGGFASNPTEFGILRFLAGLGIGGVMPNLVALTSEYAPQKMRSTLVTTMFSGYAVGGVMAALLGSWFTPSFGWEIMFFIAGIPLFLLPVIWKYLPESLTFIVKENKQEEARKIVRKLAPNVTVKEDTTFELYKVDVPEAANVASLFRRGRATNTLLFWVAFFTCLLTMYALSSWLPKLMMAAGYSMDNSLMFMMIMNVGAVVGIVGGGILADRFHLKPVLMFLGIMGAIVMSLMGFQSNQFLLYILVFLAGAASIGSQMLLYSYVAQFYPLAVRSTGIGWSSAIGRMGAIVGPILIGGLLGMNLPAHFNFIAVGLPVLITAIAVALIMHDDEPEKIAAQNVATAKA
ncbi:aromatic acid/H+ symport family MFS transporter [Acinetobacter portensis]|uniref:Aromatic acid/H+ symport family MFS transporter n=2 Tax=Acinetobacter TaxID=469 RepID=A0A6L6GG91_9GAMM|nr:MULTISPECIES: aromatic acid/H+ symport family MFS transporter [Acinetobacter]MCK7608956.1 aromatic acid/H+ symport family MFS transporter [Acinetobacter portensis]MCK7639815.1 aromatic acid/H+ symport family MFS transporter [Acinetobacter portensis]MDY6459642.1 aromatic acid/H+ symport family MFS transporter [Acinetobacter faecalis]MDY6462527.1 aromatic acid/H+ symport family MFS transporter [Acinetobacter faecalis]MDY6485251.1 aromatic acid/H+ symport family MFS transporter [Acinetobacter 